MSGDKIAIFTGSDAMAYTNLEFGGCGAIIGVANIAPKIAATIFDGYRSGDLQSARDAQLRLLPLIEAIEIGRFPAGLKEAMKQIGVPVGDAKEPLPRLTDEEVRSLKRLLSQAGFRARDRA